MHKTRQSRAEQSRAFFPRILLAPAPPILVSSFRVCLAHARLPGGALLFVVATILYRRIPRAQDNGSAYVALKLLPLNDTEPVSVRGWCRRGAVRGRMEVIYLSAVGAVVMEAGRAVHW